MAMRLLRRLFNLRNRTVLLRNDCLPVIFALRKGSPSQVLQKAAEDVCKEALEAGCRVLALHVPGVQLIDERIDGGSREGALRLAGPACTQRTRNEIRALLARHPWTVSAGTAPVDLFAAQSNAFVERFVSWTDESKSEVVDAFTLRSWNQSRCPCGKDHRETSFIFPPRGLERTVVRRAKSDRLRACLCRAHQPQGRILEAVAL